jgi:hypothetical protein
MSKENSRVATTADPSGDRVADDVTERTRQKDVELSMVDSSLVSKSIDRFKELVDRELDEKLDDEEVQIRLQQVRRRVDRWSDGSSGDRSIDDLARKGYRLVQLWLLLVTAIEPNKVGLDSGAIDEIAQETVAQAINLVCDEPAVHHDWDTAFVVRCIGCLPQAYRSWRLRGGMLNAEELEQVRSTAFGNALVESLRRCVSGHQAAQLLREWGNDAEDVEDTLALTRRALQLPADAADQE